jgi:hypothetical protein
MATTTDKGSWKNRPSGGAVLIADEGGELFHVQVRGSDLPIPVQAKTSTRAKAVLKAQNPPLIAVGVTPAPQDEIDQLLASAAGEPIDVGGADVTQADVLGAIEDTLLTGSTEKAEAISAKVARKVTEGVKVTGQTTREAKPDPKPGAKRAAAKAAPRGATRKAAAAKKAAPAKPAAAKKGNGKPAAKPAAKAAPAKKANGNAAANARSAKAQADRAKVVALWGDKTFSPETWAEGGTPRRKAIVAKMPAMRGRVLGVLTAEGIDGKGKPTAA